MSVFNAGLPQASSTTGFPVGYTMLMPTTGTIVTIGNQQWLRAGNAVTASAFPDAAREPSLKIATLTAHARTATLQVRAIATDGNGTFVATDANGSNNVYVTTDGGATWTTSVVPGGFNVAGVAWGGGRFMVIGNTVSTILTAWSSNGTSWTAGPSLSGTYTSDTSCITYGNSLFVGVTDGTTNAGFTSVNGTSLTAFNMASPVVNPQIAWNGSGFMIVGTTAQAYRSTNGSTWTSVSLTPTRASGVVPFLAGANGVFVYITGSFSAARSTDNGVSWSLNAAPWGLVNSYGIYTGNNQFLTFDQSGLLGAGKTVWVSSDYLSWSSLRFDKTFADTSGYYTAIGYDGTRLVTLSDTTGYYCTNVNRADFVGLVDPASVPGSSSYLYSYVRIK